MTKLIIAWERELQAVALKIVHVLGGMTCCWRIIYSSSDALGIDDHCWLDRGRSWTRFIEHRYLSNFQTSLSSFIIVLLHCPFIKCQRDWFYLHSLISSFLNTTFMDFHTVDTFDMWWGEEKHICRA